MRDDVVGVKGPNVRKPVLIVTAGNTFPDVRQMQGDFDDWIAAGLGESVPQLRVDARKQLEFPFPAELSGVVITGSHAMVTDREPWSERLAAWLKTCVQAQVPMLGICYGHQLLAHALGGQVGNRPEGIEIGTHTIRLTEAAAEDPLFQTMPQQFGAQLVHKQSVLGLPPDAVLLASGENEAHQAYRVGPCAWGVQFHPEFSVVAMQAYLDKAAAEVRAAAVKEAVQGGDAAVAVAEVAPRAVALPTVEAAGLLKRFAGLTLTGVGVLV